MQASLFPTYIIIVNISLFLSCYLQVECHSGCRQMVAVGRKLACLDLTHQSDSEHHPAGWRPTLPPRKNMPGGQETGCWSPEATTHITFESLFCYFTTKHNTGLFPTKEIHTNQDRKPEAEETGKERTRCKWLIMKIIPFPALHLCPCAFACFVSVALAIHAFVWQHFKGSLQ
ncbi:hypothetical protein OYC64_015531 [Pagothenia borchgrevinki]|uniref:Uncharacterized protein n=1 Tax=Pagothenia borchgrevinki TaxID=8213 RepID=A0ABD2HGN3_PAGBO